jgi:hypothetical protein
MKREREKLAEEIEVGVRRLLVDGKVEFAEAVGSHQRHPRNFHRSAN